MAQTFQLPLQENRETLFSSEGADIYMYQLRNEPLGGLPQKILQIKVLLSAISFILTLYSIRSLFLSQISNALASVKPLNPRKSFERLQAT